MFFMYASLHATDSIYVHLAQEQDFSVLRKIFFEAFGKVLIDDDSNTYSQEKRMQTLGEAYDVEWNKWKHKKADWYVASKAKQIVGFLIVDPYVSREKIFFRGIGVATAYQNQGIGTALVAKVCQTLRESFPQAKQFIWFSRKDNTQAKQFCKSFGNFRSLENFEGIYDPKIYDGYECYFPSSY